MTAEQFQKQFNVSRETFERLDIYVETLKKWQRKINLVSPQTVPDIWRRHFADSAQLFDLINGKDMRIADIGSGAGFPGMVLAIIGCTNVSLIESDQRKCLFLKDVARQTGVKCEIINERIENVEGEFDLITARALADLSQLLNYVVHLCPKGNALFLKGQSVDDEVRRAQDAYRFDIRNHPSMTDNNGVIIKISNLNVSRET